MKAVVIILAVLVTLFVVSQALTNCERCKYYCSYKNCSQYMCVRHNANDYCCCFNCAGYSYFNIARVSRPQVEEMREIPSIYNFEN
uniref:Mytilin 5 n=1 Tax=Perna viridis TaxID=73031 RepID=A0A6B9XQJ7_PERVI|nr:mytilin 5 [Perna viridis]